MESGKPEAETQIYQSEEAPALHVEIPEKQSYTPKEDMVIDWLKAHPEDLQLSNRKLAEKIGTTHPTVSAAKRKLKGE